MSRIFSWLQTVKSETWQKLALLAFIYLALWIPPAFFGVSAVVAFAYLLLAGLIAVIVLGCCS